MESRVIERRKAELAVIQGEGGESDEFERSVRADLDALPTIDEPTDAIVRVSRAYICGSDLWPYKLLEPVEGGRPTGLEAIGVVEAVGKDVRSVRPGDFVMLPFTYSDGTCEFCNEGLHTACARGGFFGVGQVGGAQAEAVRVPLADGTLFVVPGRADEALMAGLLTLSDVMGTGHQRRGRCAGRAGQEG